MREKFELKPETIAYIDDFDTKSPREKCDYSRLRNGWWGTRYSEDDPIMSWSNAKHFLLLSMYIERTNPQLIVERPERERTSQDMAR